MVLLTFFFLLPSLNVLRIYTWFCAQGSLLMRLRLLEIEPDLIACKASALLVILSLRSLVNIFQSVVFLWSLTILFFSHDIFYYFRSISHAMTS